jgi:3-phosphoinositide dependent protein kinase-1
MRARAQVMYVTRKDTQKQYAMKVVDKAFVLRHNKQGEMLNEKTVLSLLKHPFVVRLETTFQDSHSLYYVLQLGAKGELFTLIRQAGRLDPPLAAFLCAELVAVLEYLHGCGVVHRDLKPENVLLTQEGHILLTDFATSKLLRAPPAAPVSLSSSSSSSSTSSLASASASASAPGPASAATTSSAPPATGAANGGTGSGRGQRQRQDSFVGTADYVSPEVLNSQPVGPPADLWALGCVLYQMLVGKPPFRAESEYLTFQRVLQRDLKFPPDMDARARDLIDRLLATQPDKRLGAPGDAGGGYAALRAHPFFAGIDFERIATSKPPPYPPVFEELGISQFERARAVDAAQHAQGADAAAALRGDDDADSDEQEFAGGEARRPAKPSSTAERAAPAEAPSSTASDRADEVWRQFLSEGERIVFRGRVSKRRIFSQRRELILTSKPRIIYVDPEKMQLRGEVPWSDRLRPELKSDRVFYIHTPHRTYYMEALSCSAAEWVAKINAALREHGVPV